MQQLGVKVATPVGIIVGQLLFGWLGDVMGRKRICKPFLTFGLGRVFTTRGLCQMGQS